MEDSDEDDEFNMDKLCNELGEMDTQDIIEKRKYLEAQVAEQERRF